MYYAAAVTSMYMLVHVQVYECEVMYVHCTYTIMIVNMCMYIVQTRDMSQPEAVQPELHNHTSLLPGHLDSGNLTTWLVLVYESIYSEVLRTS